MRSETNSDLSNEPRPGSTPTDGYLTLGQAAATLPGRPHLSTLHRWRLRGVRGVRLRTCLVGGRRFTRREWLSEFIEASSEAGDRSGIEASSEAGDQHAAPTTAPAAGREQAIRAAEAELDAAGI